MPDQTQTQDHLLTVPLRDPTLSVMQWVQTYNLKLTPLTLGLKQEQLSLALCQRGDRLIWLR